MLQSNFALSTLEQDVHIFCISILLPMVNENLSTKHHYCACLHVELHDDHSFPEWVLTTHMQLCTYNAKVYIKRAPNFFLYECNINEPKWLEYKYIYQRTYAHK